MVGDRWNRGDWRKSQLYFCKLEATTLQVQKRYFSQEIDLREKVVRSMILSIHFIQVLLIGVGNGFSRCEN